MKTVDLSKDLRLPADILLGYEVGTGSPVRIPLTHTVVTGLTQKSGKTTTLEALIARSGMRALAFRTKRGEQDFAGARRHAPFFRERADWQYVAALLEATMRERMKFERSWIIRVCKGARTLRQVLRNVEDALETAKGLSESVFTTLKAYLEIVLPELEHVDFARELRLQTGVNVMDLEDLRDEVQALVIASTLEALYDEERDTIVVIPEAWKFAPEGRGSPVKHTAERYIRQGANIGLFLFLDSQDIAGVDKALLKQVDTWILGRQKEINEVEHTLAQVPLPKRLRPSPEDIMQLGLGHFVACYDDAVRRVYVQPAWLDEATAVAVARGTVEVKVAKVKRAKEETDVDVQERQRVESEIAQLRKESREHEGAAKKLLEDEKAIRRERDSLREEVLKLRKEATQRAPAFRDAPAPKRASVEIHADPDLPEGGGQVVDVDAIVGLVVERLRSEADSILLQVRRELPDLEVHVDRPVVQASDEDYRGKIAVLLHEGFFDHARTAYEVRSDLVSRGWQSEATRGVPPHIYKELDWLTSKGFFRMAPGVGKKGATWAEVDGARERVRET